MPLNALIVDDSRAMRALVKKTLKAAGFQVDECLEAGDGLEALEMIRKHQVDLVLCDLNMPRMDGMEFLKSMHQEGIVPECFIMVTTEGRKEKLKEALRYGARGYVIKPFQPEKLRRILTMLMGEPEMAEDGAEGLDF